MSLLDGKRAVIFGVATSEHRGQSPRRSTPRRELAFTYAGEILKKRVHFAGGIAKGSSFL